MSLKRIFSYGFLLRLRLFRPTWSPERRRLEREISQNGTRSLTYLRYCKINICIHYIVPTVNSITTAVMWIQFVSKTDPDRAWIHLYIVIELSKKFAEKQNIIIHWEWRVFCKLIVAGGGGAYKRRLRQLKGALKNFIFIKVTKSWHDYQCREVVRDYQHAVLQVRYCGGFLENISP